MDDDSSVASRRDSGPSVHSATGGADSSHDGTSVMVCARFRPPNAVETRNGAADGVVEFAADGRSLTLLARAKALSKGGKQRFTFDHVFAPDRSQQDVFDSCVRDRVRDIFEGYNATIFAYGQTGSGKTHTMMGLPDDDELSGIIPRLSTAVFAHIENDTNEHMQYTIKVAYVEIYKEQIQDLLDPQKSNLKVRESKVGVWIEDVTEIYVSSAEEVLQVMHNGGVNRSMASTLMNSESSRSHAVFMLTVGQVDKATGTKRGSKLTLVDLAGSEKVAKSGARGQTLDEAKHINKSLSALGNVINALTTSATHVPYRDSKLTRLLSDSLGGNSKTCLVVTCSPCSYNVDETLSTLRFGYRAKSIKNKVRANVELSAAEYQRLLAQAVRRIKLQASIIAEYETELLALKGSGFVRRSLELTALNLPGFDLAGDDDTAANDDGRAGKDDDDDDEDARSRRASSLAPVAEDNATETDADAGADVNARPDAAIGEGESAQAGDSGAKTGEGVKSQGAVSTTAVVGAADALGNDQTAAGDAMASDDKDAVSSSAATAIVDGASGLTDVELRLLAKLRIEGDNESASADTGDVEGTAAARVARPAWMVDLSTTASLAAELSKAAAATDVDASNDAKAAAKDGGEQESALSKQVAARLAEDAVLSNEWLLTTTQQMQAWEDKMRAQTVHALKEAAAAAAVVAQRPSDADKDEASAAAAAAAAADAAAGDSGDAAAGSTVDRGEYEKMMQLFRLKCTQYVTLQIEARRQDERFQKLSRDYEERFLMSDAERHEYRRRQELETQCEQLRQQCQKLMASDLYLRKRLGGQVVGIPLDQLHQPVVQAQALHSPASAQQRSDRAESKWERFKRAVSPGSSSSSRINPSAATAGRVTTSTARRPGMDMFF